MQTTTSTLNCCEPNNVLIFMTLLNPIFYFFFFKGSATPRDLPSSPTRRSPDLALETLLEAETAGDPMSNQKWQRSSLRRLSLQLTEQQLSISHTTVGRLLVQLNYSLKANRSEEHTSELQSPCNLVCRLLLEKKK